MFVKGLEVLGMKYEERTEPWNGACGVYSPLLTEAAIRFQSEMITETFPAQGPVKTQIVGAIDRLKEEAADRVREDMNYTLTERMIDYRSEHERMLFNLGLAGSAFKKVYESVHVIMPRHSVASLKNNVFKNHDKMHDELDFQTLSGISNKIKEAAEEEENSLLILDDVTVALKDKFVQRLLRDLILNRRHYRLSIWLLVQTYNAITFSPVRPVLRC